MTTDELAQVREEERVNLTREQAQAIVDEMTAELDALTEDMIHATIAVLTTAVGEPTS